MIPHEIADRLAASSARFTSDLRDVFEAIDTYIAAQDAENERLRSIVRDISTHSKHGPLGRGEAGPCSAACIKCRAEAWIKANGPQP